MTALDDDTLERLRQMHADRSEPVHALWCALYFCWRRERPIPDWLYFEIATVLDAQRRKRPGRGQRSPAEKHNDALTDFLRWATVRSLREEDGLPWHKVWEAISERRRGTAAAHLPPNEKGDARAFEESYKRVQRQQK